MFFLLMPGFLMMPVSYILASDGSEENVFIDQVKWPRG